GAYGAALLALETSGTVVSRPDVEFLPTGQTAHSCGNCDGSTELHTPTVRMS
ncbi:MAG: benzoyl-CoA reductase, partial [Comamonadaceae bacterium]